MLLYRKAVHPEFFGIEGRRCLEQSGAEVEGWVFKGGHCARYQLGPVCLVEVVTDNPAMLPDKALSMQLPCAGERDHQDQVSDALNYLTTIQTETLSDHLYLGTYREMLERGRNNESLMSMWKDDNGRPNLSVLDLERYKNELHVQAYHLRSDCGLVLRTQSMIEIDPSKIVKA